MLNLIDGCLSCGTFQRIPVEDLYSLGIDRNICEFCLKEYLDNDEKNDIIKTNFDKESHD